MFTASIF